MGNLADKADQLEKAIQEMAFDGIQERRDYDASVKLLEIAEDVWHISERLGAIEGPSTSA